MASLSPLFHVPLVVVLSCGNEWRQRGGLGELVVDSRNKKGGQGFHTSATAVITTAIKLHLTIPAPHS